ncbi:MAG TPA: response regulator [Desulfobacterales bacterium]|nr:response regulator [Desulfobacterales bacterium]
MLEPNYPAADGASSACILIVDDDYINRELLANLFLDKKYHIIQAADGTEAVRLARDQRPDLVLLDIMMPGIDGYEVCAILRREYPDIPVIMQSSLSSNEAEIKGLAAGAAGFISKPLDARLILAQVEIQLGIKRDRDLSRRQRDKLAWDNRKLEHELAGLRHIEEELWAAKRETAVANQVRDGMIKDLFAAMCELLSSRDFYTFEHGMRVSSLSRHIGELLGLDRRQLDALELGGMIHDISKVAIPDDVLLKPGIFDKQDREIMRLHPAMGAKIFSRRQCDPMITDIIYQHHERLDGSGYPQGLHGDDIGLLPRIVMVADTYEAVVARRPYKKSQKRQEALRLLRCEASCGRLDSEMVEVLAQVTENWNPLSASHFVSDKNTRALEAFRRKTYFKEPLSDFYNYRYLFFLNNSGLLDIPAQGYTLCKISCGNLDEINESEGYLKTDQILDDTGSKLHDVLEDAADCAEISCINILFRKGVTYLIYSNCPPTALKILLARLEHVLLELKRDWRLQASLCRRHFAADYSMERALYELLAEQPERID